MMKLKIGSPVSGENFYPRPAIVGILRKALNRDHVSFLAPRRTGKTSILMHLEETAAPDHPHFRINLETCTRPAQMISALIRAFGEDKPRWKTALGSVKKSVADTLSRVNKIGPDGVTLDKAVETDWQRPAESFLTELLKHDGPITFLLDEFPILVDAAAKEDRAECETMLRWFREWRQRTSETEVRFLVTGSIGLDNVVRRHGLADTVNDFDSVDLPPFSQEEASDFIIKLAKGIRRELDESHAERMIDLLGNAYPYFLQIFVAEIDEQWPAEGDTKTLSLDFIDRLYHERLVAGPRNKYLPHMWDRLDKTLAKQETHLARAILRAVAQGQDGLSGEQMTEAARSALPQSESLDASVLGYVLEVLKHDGYLLQDLQAPFRTRFFSNLLRDYWKRRYA